MQSLRPQSRRISSLRPLRPPTCLLNSNRSRVFTSRAPLHLIGRSGPRPQLPFLNSSFRGHRHGVFAIRLVSTEQKAYIKYQLRLGAYWTVMGWIVLGGLAGCYFVLRQDWLDKLYPAPDDFGWLAKYAWRRGRHEEQEEAFGRGMTDWGAVGSSYNTVLLYCEKGTMIRGREKPLPQNMEWDQTIPGIDVDDIWKELVSALSEAEKIGYDVSVKTEQWRRAYFHAMMGIAKAAEMNDGWVRDKWRHLLFPADQMVGPSNPYPKPLWPGSPPAPKEEDCEAAYDPPNMWYTRILTTKGFTRDQRLAAALAYASWLDYSGDSETASSLYTWSLSLAASPQEDQTTTLLNPTTGIIPQSAPYTTPNILSACTAVASHYARTNATPKALNIYTSVLRARRNAPSAPPFQQYSAKPPDLSLTSIDSALRWVTSIPFRSHMPAPPPSGDAPYQRTSASACEDAALMGYVGEILFASSSGSKQRREALSWTRDAVALAEEGHEDARLDDVSRRVCAQCLGSGLENWYKMVGVLAKEEDDARREGKKMGKKKGWSLWATSGEGMVEQVGAEEGEWKREQEMVARRKGMFSEARLMEQLNRHISTKSKWFVV